ncbi:hypothetical protein Salat_1240100 [Sesamum alatum]|uniref:Uncharacterized protein n=1 Tax=Sesamum alatum TaxID=300844 RepID=A0AAE1YG44_9LAMI|nr:hypothetical protein Salat_1240100 [Sesamum alatum]
MLLRRETEPDLRRRRFDGDAMPADAAAAHFVAVIGRRQRARRLPRHIPSEARNQDERHNRGGEDENTNAAEAPPNRQSVGLHGSDYHQVERRQIPHHRVGNRHSADVSRAWGSRCVRKLRAKKK